MRNLISTILLLASVTLASSGVLALQVNFEYKTFNIPGEGVFLETHLNFLGGSMKYSKNTEGLVQAKIEALILIKEGEDIIKYEKIELLSPETSDSTVVDFLDLRRFQLLPGEYVIELEIKDLLDPEATPLLHKELVKLENYDELSVSDIILLSAWSKTTTPNDLSRSGYDLIPRVSNFYESTSDKLGFYAELYNTDAFFGEDEKFVLSYYVSKPNSEPLKETMSIKPLKGAKVVPIFKLVNLSSLTEGNYNLIIEIRNNLNEVEISKSFNFFKGGASLLEDIEVENSFVERITDIDSLTYFIETLHPKGTYSEQRFINGIAPISSNLKQYQNFLLNFWYKRNPQNPEAAFENYNLLIKAVNEEFKTINKEGWQTDRGRVYLEYGPPNTRVDRPNFPGFKPFEIWHYYQCKELQNRRFVFLERELSVGDYDLIQSDMRGEPFDQFWMEKVLGSKDEKVIDSTNPYSNRDAHPMGTNNGLFSILQDLYLNPR